MTPYRRRMYPKEWKELALDCKVRANWACEHCGAQQFDIRESKKGTPYFVYLHAAHKHQDDLDNPQPELLCLCISCHGRYDAAWRERRERVRLECLKHLRLLIEQGMVEVRYHTDQRVLTRGDKTN